MSYFDASIQYSYYDSRNNDYVGRPISVNKKGLYSSRNFISANFDVCQQLVKKLEVYLKNFG